MKVSVNLGLLKFKNLFDEEKEIVSRRNLKERRFLYL